MKRFQVFNSNFPFISHSKKNRVSIGTFVKHYRYMIKYHLPFVVRWAFSKCLVKSLERRSISEWNQTVKSSHFIQLNYYHRHSNNLQNIIGFLFFNQMIRYLRHQNYQTKPSSILNQTRPDYSTMQLMQSKRICCMAI